MLNKKGELPWWMILLVLALLFLLVVSFVFSGGIERTLTTFGVIEDKTSGQADDLDIFDGLEGSSESEDDSSEG